MNTIDQHAKRGRRQPGDNPEGSKAADLSAEDEEDNFKPLTAQEAQAWRARQRPLSIWRVLAWQGLAGVLVGLLWWFSGRRVGALSAWYGAATVWFPAVLMAWGLMLGRLSRVLSVSPKGALTAVYFWEGVKVILSVALMVLAPKALERVDWLALLVGLVVVIKVNGLALWVLSRSTDNKVDVNDVC